MNARTEERPPLTLEPTPKVKPRKPYSRRWNKRPAWRTRLAGVLRAILKRVE